MSGAPGADPAREGLPEQPLWGTSAAGIGPAPATSPAIRAASPPSPPVAPERPPATPAPLPAETIPGDPELPVADPATVPTEQELAADAAIGAQQEAMDVGVPSDDAFGLPSFDSYGRGWFERDGLKFRLGPVNLRLSLALGAEYNDNIFGSNTNRTPDTIGAVTPNILLAMGDFRNRSEDFLALTYAPEFRYYLENSDQDRVNENLAIAGQATLSRYSTQVALNYASSNSPNATQTGGNQYSQLNFNWQNRYYLGAKTFVSLTTGALLQNSDNDNNYQTFTLSPQLGYSYSPKTTVSFGPFAGIAYVGDGASQTFQGLNATLQYDTLRKLTFTGTLGIQSRQYSGQEQAGVSNFTTPTFALAAEWTPRPEVSVELGLVRDVQLSDLSRGLTFTNNQITLNVSNLLFGRFDLDLGLSYQNLDYQGDSDVSGRQENFFSGSISLGYAFWKNSWSVSVFYRRQERTSDQSQFDYQQNVYGVRATYSF